MACTMGLAIISQKVSAADAPPKISFDSDATGRIGTIDTAKLANDLGWDRDMNANIETLKAQLGSELQKLGGLFGAQLEAKQKELGLSGSEKEKEEKFKKLTVDQQQQYAGMAQNAQQQMGQVQQVAQQQMQKYVQDWNKEYGDAIRPLVAQVAAEKRLSVVVNIQVVSVIWSDPGVDITGAVFKVASKNPPKLRQIEPPKLFKEPLPTTQEALKIAATQNAKPTTPTTPTTPTGTKPR